MLILAIDTSGASVSAAVSRDLEIVAQYTRDSQFSGEKMTHSQTLLPIIARLLQDAMITPDSLDAVALCNGPGSYTGLRIGLACAKGIAFANHIPIIGVSTLQVTAYPHREFDGNICPMTDARRGLVYAAIIGDNALPDAAYDIDYIIAFVKNTNTKALFAGDGADLHSKKIKDALGENAFFVQKELNIINAADIIPFAVSSLQKGEINSAFDCELNYCRIPQAQRELAEKNNALTDIVIKPFAPCYIDKAAEIEAMCFSMPWSQKSFQELIENEAAKYFVALINDEVVGIVGSRHLIDFVEISNVAVSPHYRRRGVAQRLMRRVFACGNENNLYDFTLEVRSGDEGARALYQKMGFKEEGIRKNFYELPKDDGVVMWKREKH